jgi:hypothetical protein
MINARNEPFLDTQGTLDNLGRGTRRGFAQEGQDSWYSLLCAPSSEMDVSVRPGYSNVHPSSRP